MKKQLISFILIFALMLAMLPQFSLMVFAASAPDTTIGLDFSDCTADWTGTGSYVGVNWEYSTQTLTLTNANIHGKDNASGSFGISVPGGTTVVLIGNNTAIGGISENTNSNNYGLYSTGALTIQGTGSLIATGGLNTGNPGYSQGIRANALSISGGTVTATGGSAELASNGYSNGISADTVTISGGIVTATAGSAYTSVGMIANTVNLNSGLFIARAGVAGNEAKAFRKFNGAATVNNYGTGIGALTGSPTAKYAVYGNTGTYKVSTAGLDFSGNPANTGTLASNGYQWVQGTKTLTVNNLILNTTALSAIKLPDGAILDVQGINVVRSGDSAANYAKSYGIWGAGGLSIQNTGTITTIGGNMTGADFGSSYGVFAYNINTSSAAVNAIAGTATSHSIGIYSIGGTASVNISGGSVTAVGGTTTVDTTAGGTTGSFSCGIMQDSNKVIISGGNITAMGGTVNLNYFNTVSAGIFTLYAPTITGGHISAIGGTTVDSTNGNSSGIYLNHGDSMTVSGGNITAIGNVHGFQSAGLILINNVEVPVASINIDGSSPVTYDGANLGTYKYIVVGQSNYTATINLKKDGGTWTSSGKTITLQQASETPTVTTEAAGVYTANVANGTWKILADGTDTGSTVVINNGAASQDLNYYTVHFAVTNVGTASGSAITATYNSSEIYTGDVALGGKQLVITAVGQGSSNYTYSWNGAGAHGEMTAALTIPSLGEAVNVTCIVNSKAPKIMTPSLPNGSVGTAYNQSFSAMTLAPITWDITAGTLPAGLSLDPNTGAITGTPVAAGTSNFTVTATNSFGTDSKALSITMISTGTAPAITTASLADGTAGTAYSQTLAATGTVPITWDITAGTLPAGLSLDPNTGEITGTPAAAGTSNFTVKATNSFGTDTKALSITINSTGTAPAITTTSLPSGTVGTAYSQTLVATGTAPITWDITAGTLPAGLSLDPNTGEITGIPTMAETSTFSAIAINGVYPDDTKLLSITIATTGAALTITTTSLPSGTVGTAYNQTLAATGTAPITWDITTGTLPAGLSLDQNTGAISGTPAAAGTSNFTVKATNSFGTDTKALSITINSIGTAPAITTTGLADGTAGTAYSRMLAATGTAPITWDITTGTLPTGLSLDQNTGAITGTPAAGTSNFTVKATNTFGNDIKTYSIYVAAVSATYTLTITAGSGGAVSSAGGTYEAGTFVYITAIPNRNYSFSNWITSNGGSFTDSSSASTTFTMPANNTTITAAFTYNGGGGGSNGGTLAPVPTSDPTTNATPTQIPIIVDDNNYYIGNVAVEDNTATITVDQSEFEKQLATAKYSVVIPVTSDARTVVAQLVVKNVQDMNDKGVSLIVQTGSIRYNIPAYAIDTKGILSALGEADPSLVPMNVTIKTVVDQSAQTLVNSAVASAGAKVVIPPVQFEVTATYNNKNYKIETFDRFVNRSVEITQEQALQITTAIVVNPDGTTRHVPTFVYQKDNKWHANINSLTNSTYVLIFNEMSFSDITGRWYESIVNEMGSRKIISGVGKNSFAGDKDITRAEFAAIVVRALGLPTKAKSTFSDVLSDAWYSSAVATAAQYGIVGGIGNNKFAPHAKITREEAMQMIYKASMLIPYTAVSGVDNTKNFRDYGTHSVWATDAVNFSLNNGLIKGFNGKFNPKSSITRAESATIVLKLLQSSNLVDVRAKL